jgi:hypothetical protein
MKKMNKTKKEEQNLSIMLEAYYASIDALENERENGKVGGLKALTPARMAFEVLWAYAKQPWCWNMPPVDWNRLEDGDYVNPVEWRQEPVHPFSDKRMDQYVQVILDAPDGAEWACQVARMVLKGPFVEGEDKIAGSAEWGYRYAVEIIDGRFRKGEAAIMQDEFYAERYNNRFGVDDSSPIPEGPGTKLGPAGGSTAVADAEPGE